MSRKTVSTESKTTGTDLDQAAKLVGEIAAIVGHAPKLTAKERARSQKLRKGGEPIIPTVATLSEKFGLTVASHRTTTMLEKAKRAESLIPLHKDLVMLTKQISDHIFAASSESWTAATVHYSMLKRLAKTDGDLQVALAPVEQFFKQRSAAVLAERKAAREARKAAKAAKGASPPLATEPPAETTLGPPVRSPVTAAPPAPPAVSSPTAPPAPPAPTGAAAA
jgi:hypothetical protein